MSHLRREMELCPRCHALESARIYHTKRDKFGNMIRYRKCRHCGAAMKSEVLLVPKLPPEVPAE